MHWKKMKSILELTNEMWKCVITAMYSIAGVVISGRSNSSPQYKTRSVTQFHLLHLVWCIQASREVQHLRCWSFVIVKHYDGFSIKLKRVHDSILWMHRTSAQQQCVSYTVLHSVTSSASKSLWTSRRLWKSDFVSQGKEEIYPFIWEFISDQK